MATKMERMMITAAAVTMEVVETKKVRSGASLCAVYWLCIHEMFAMNGSGFRRFQNCGLN
jgi:hypothetical protein